MSVLAALFSCRHEKNRVLNMHDDFYQNFFLKDILQHSIALVIWFPKNHEEGLL